MTAWAEGMLLWSWQSLLLVALIFAFTRLDRSRPAVRYSLWLIGVLAIAALPAANALITALPAASPAVAPIIGVAPITFIAQLPATARPLSSPSPEGADTSRELLIPSLFVLWLVGVAIAAWRTAADFIQWRRIRRSIDSTEEKISGVPAYYSTLVESPALVGIFRPMIVLPASIKEWAGAEELRAVVLHEMAHVARRDNLMSPIQVVLNALLFFHPAVRYALQQLILERELACDARVIAAGTSARVYADIILKTAERSIQSRQSDCPAFNSSGKILNRRIEMIFKPESSAGNRWRVAGTARAALVLAFAALVLPQGSVASIAEETPSKPTLQSTASQPLVESVTAIARVVKEPAAAPAPAVAPQAPAQAQTAGVAGIAFDQTGAVIPGVRVTLSNTASAQSLLTNDSGAYAFRQVEPGEYAVQARFPGFQNSERTISVRPGETANGDIVLALGRSRTFVEISTNRPAVPQAPVPVSPGPTRIGGDLLTPTLLISPEPVYPAAARARQIQGTVQLQAVIDTGGNVTGLQLENAVNMALAQAAMDAVKQWKYRPAMLNGQPVDFPTSITLNFSLVD